MQFSLFAASGGPLAAHAHRLTTSRWDVATRHGAAFTRECSAPMIGADQWRTGPMRDMVAEHVADMY